MFTKEESRKKIQELTESFEGKIDFIKTSGNYKEAQIEDEFIKPLFRYLNWNISNEGIGNPSDREFIVQAKGRNGKEPDYLLQLDQKPKFYVEAKHTKYYLGGKVEHATTKERTDYIWQAYSYSYSTQSLSATKKVDFALLTDFEEFRFFDCTFPVKDNSLLNNYCVLDWTYKDYIENFDKLWDYFEKENVRQGSLNKLYINEKKVKENRIPPDKAFLKDLDDEKDGWRIKLAKDIKKYQPDLSAEFITQSVQLILDRFIFIKVLSDREIEEDIIHNLVNKIQNIKEKSVGAEDSSAQSIYDECKDIFQELDKTYNGSIFIKRPELDSVKVSNKVLLEILKDLQPENSRYNFKVIPIEILGTIYEQFLGKVVVTTDKRASIDYKPEVRKAGGVYYTPDYIVNYIVEKTIGEKLKECKKFEDLLEIKICDPACGSGSFLIAAYDTLIKWTIEYYKSKVKVEGDVRTGFKPVLTLSKEERKLVYLDSDGQVRLTSKIKRDILKSCIYGVDIDAQAVEVTKMSLSLKALENTNHYEVHNERTLFHTTILPTLEGNIKCGNSLVGTDFLIEKLILNTSDDKRINAFDWEIEFKDIIIKEGFNCIIGNPPYLYSAGKNQIEYFNKNYKLSEYQTDFYIFFIEKALKLLKKEGLFSFIIPDSWLNSENFSKLRLELLSENRLLSLAIFDYPVFDKVALENSIFVISRAKSNKDFNVYKFSQPKKYSLFNKLSTDECLKSGLINPFSSKRINKILSKIENNSIKIKEIYQVNRGLHAYRTDGYGKSKFSKGFQTKKDRDLQSYHSTKKEDDTYLKEYKGKNINRFSSIFAGKYLSYGNWLAEPREDKFMYNPKIIIRKILGNKLHGTFLEEPAAIDQSLYIIISKEGKYSLFHTLGILLSSIGAWYLREKYSIYDSLYPWYTKKQLSEFPLKFSESKSIEIVVKNLLEFNLKLNHTKSLKTSKELEEINRSILGLENKLDELVYQLYDLTPEEIKIVEGG
jgi:hypothetical protein